MPDEMLPKRIREPSFIVKVGLMTLLPVVVLGVVLGKSLGGAVRERSFEDAGRQARLIVGIVGERRLSRAASRGPSRSGRRRLDREFRTVTADGAVAGMQIIDARARVVYSKDFGAMGEASTSGRVAETLTGKASTSLDPAGKLIQVFVPLRSAPARPPSGTIRMDLPYGPIESAVASDTRKLYLIILAGLGVLCAGLLRTVSGASTRLKHQAAENEHQALRDTLTGLPNRARFNRLLDQALAACPADGLVAVLLMDLDRFKEINDTLGHFNGDLVIERVGQRLRTVLREGDTVARLGGDEFAMLLPSVRTKDAVAAAASRVHRALEEPFTAGGLALKVEASIGIALYPQDGEKKAVGLLRAADVAMYAAKKAHTGHEFYSPEQHQYSPARLGLVAQLSRAMEKQELILHYQPKARLSTGAVEGVEALVRWDHPQRGLLPPGEFVPVTEQTQMIRPVTIYLLETALERVRDWERNGLDLSVAVNLSTQMLLDLELPNEIRRILRRVGVAPKKLELEITESAIMYDPRRAQVILERLHEMGLRIAIDDFGTGFSSLVSLKHLPVSTIKIDKSFVMGMEADESDAAIVKSTAQLGQNLGLEVVAEGVETPTAWSRLAELGCDFGQGYHLSKPLDGDEFVRWLAAYRATIKSPALPSAALGDPRALRLAPGSIT